MKKLFAGFAFILTSAAAATAAQSVTLAWNPNSETNLAGYRLYYGNASRSYLTNSQVSKPLTTCTITNLAEGATYFFAVTAFTDDGLESDYSDEVSYRVPAVTRPKPPTFTNLVTISVQLEEACDLLGPWDLVTNAFSIVAPDGARFYRTKVQVTR